MSALDDFVTKSAKSYLQSVVFVDDRIYYKDKPLETSVPAPGSLGGIRPQVVEEDVDESLAPAQSPATGASMITQITASPKSASTGSQAEVPASYHPRQLMESFARNGIVCALYEPLKDFKTDRNSDLFRLCERADIVILDWDLHNDDGRGISALLTELIEAGQEESPHHVRLCAIYTDKPNLHSVLDTLLGRLVARGCKVEVAEGKLHLIAGASRVSIFGKPGSVGRPSEEKFYEVSEDSLAEKIISEFAMLHHGILPAFALHGLASVRRNTKRLLDKFRKQLDGAFLLHRSLVLAESDAFEELPELLSDEIRAILEDMWPGQLQLPELTRSASDSVPLADPARPWTTKDGVRLDAKAAFREMLALGKDGLVAALPTWSLANDIRKNGFRGIPAALLKDFESMLTADQQCWPEHLAILFCNRTQYGITERTLRFGTVVRHKAREGDPWNFSVCLMPICDSQRLRNPQRFPFWKLRSDAKCGQASKRHGIAVSIEGKTFSLAAGGKIRDALWVAPFEPSANGWVNSVTNSNRSLFETDGIIVEWVAQLKPLHAQRIAAYMGAEISRVGLVESEWLRLFCDR